MGLQDLVGPTTEHVLAPPLRAAADALGRCMRMHQRVLQARVCAVGALLSIRQLAIGLGVILSDTPHICFY